MKRFVIEYSNWKMAEFEAIEDEKERLEKQRQVDRLAWACESGLVSIHECMKSITEV